MVTQLGLGFPNSSQTDFASKGRIVSDRLRWNERSVAVNEHLKARVAPKSVLRIHRSAHHGFAMRGIVIAVQVFTISHLDPTKLGTSRIAKRPQYCRLGFRDERGFVCFALLF